MWVLILLAININNPNDIPGRISIKFDTEHSCLKAKDSVEYKLKFDNFKVTAECKRSS